jgi:hypothetical protein
MEEREFVLVLQRMSMDDISKNFTINNRLATKKLRVVVARVTRSIQLQGSYELASHQESIESVPEHDEKREVSRREDLKEGE